MEKLKNKEKWFDECVKKNGVLLSDIYRQIRDKEEK